MARLLEAGWPRREEYETWHNVRDKTGGATTRRNETRLQDETGGTTTTRRNREDDDDHNTTTTRRNRKDDDTKPGQASRLYQDDYKTTRQWWWFPGPSTATTRTDTQSYGAILARDRSLAASRAEGERGEAGAMFWALWESMWK